MTDQQHDVEVPTLALTRHRHSAASPSTSLGTTPTGARIGARIIVLANLLAAPTAINAEPSFDCGLQARDAELLICESPVLAMYDRNLAYLYRRAMSDPDARQRGEQSLDQESWLEDRNRCGADEDCLVLQYSRRVDHLMRSLPPEPDPPSIHFPHEALSWGGALRSSPAENAALVGNLTIGTRVRLLGNTGVLMHGFEWFRVGHADGTAFQWGGIICAVGTPVPGTFRTCD